MFSKSEQAYAPLDKAEPFVEDGHAQCSCQRRQRSGRSRAEVIAYTASLTSILLAFALAAVLFTRPQHESIPKPNPPESNTKCEPSTSATDFAPSDLIKYETVKFSGTASFDDEGNAFRLFNPDEPQYVGEPSPEIDAAWDNLIGGRNFYITTEEAKATWGDNYTEYYMDQYGIRAELDVLHTLHCVNKIRQALSPDYYHIPPTKSFNRYHVDHCLDILRQSIQCNGDLTLIPTRWFNGIHRRFIDSDQKHTCRNFQAIRDWTTERHNGTTALHRIGIHSEDHSEDHHH